MTFEVVTIPGVGAISSEYSFWTGFKFTVKGQRVKPRTVSPATV